MCTVCILSCEYVNACRTQAFGVYSVFYLLQRLKTSSAGTASAFSEHLTHVYEHSLKSTFTLKGLIGVQVLAFATSAKDGS